METREDRLFHFAYLMCGDRDVARELVLNLFRVEATGECPYAETNFENRLRALAALVRDHEGKRARHMFKILDDVLRTDQTRPIDHNSDVIGNEPRRVVVLLWELKRTCLTAVLGCLPATVREAFVLSKVFRYRIAFAVDIAQTTESAYRVRLTRAVKRVEDYLAPRCQHINPENPCTCTGRLAIALEQKFVCFPPHDDAPGGPFQVDATHDACELYKQLSPPLPIDEVDPDERGEAVEGAERVSP